MCFSPRVGSSTHDTCDTIHTTPRVQLEDQSSRWMNCASGHLLQSPNKKQQCLNWKKLRPFTRNKHPPTTAWSPWTMRVINNSLNTQKRPCPTEENNFRQKREKVFIRAFWEFNFTSVTDAQQLLKHVCLPLLWKGQHEAMTPSSTWDLLQLDAACLWHERIKQVVLQSSNISIYMLCCGCVLYSGHRGQHKVFPFQWKQLVTSGPLLATFFAALRR